MINDLEIINKDDKCSDGYESLLSYSWPGLKEGCYCADKKFYEKSSCSY